MSNIARGILETVFCFSKGRGNITHETIDMQDGNSIHIKDITITPYTVDHSAYRGIYISNRGRRKKNSPYTETSVITDIRVNY